MWINLVLSPSPDFNPPLITGRTTVSETQTLELICDASNSVPLPSVRWMNSEGTNLSFERELRIEDVGRNDTGTYTCQATELFTNLSLSQSVDVTVQCESQPQEESM